jgi:hypothetical protein
LKIFEKLNKLETDLEDLKKDQFIIKTDISKIKEDLCFLTNDKEFMDVNNFINSFNEILKFYDY